MIRSVEVMVLSVSFIFDDFREGKSLRIKSG